ncbi:MAG: hypothetical protein ACW986_04080 [Promethearchaeota archaeon]|jgi:hypothetical protein
MVNITSYFEFEGNLGKKAKIIGEIAKDIWQHLTEYIDSHPYMYYFNLKDGHQIVIYTKEDISCKNRLEIYGEVIKVEGKHKNPRSKIHDKFLEYQLIVENWECLESKESK